MGNVVIFTTSNDILILLNIDFTFEIFAIKYHYYRNTGRNIGNICYEMRIFGETLDLH